MSELFQRLAGRFQKGGVRHVFGITGSGSSLKLINTLLDQGIEYYPVSHEGAAGLMAGGACFDYRSRAAALTIKGPGFANLLPAMLANRYESRPALSISEAYPISVPDHQQHKRLDHHVAANPFAKASLTIDQTGTAIDQAVLVAERETPGPVHLDLVANPENRQDGSEEGDATKDNGTDQPTLDRIVDRIKASHKPAIVLGSWAMRQGMDIDWFAPQVPVITTAAAKGAVNESHPLFAGIMTGERSEFSPESNLLAEADLVVGFGLRNSEVIRPLPMACPLITVDSSTLVNPEGFAPLDRLVTARYPAPEIRGLLEALSEQGGWGESSVSEWRSTLDGWILQDDWQAGSAFRCLQGAESADRPSRLVLDTGFFCTVGESIWRCAKPGDAVGSGVGRFMGVSIPTAIGLGIADRSRRVICVAGDGGVGPYIAELQLAAREKLPIRFVHMSDGGFGSVAAFSDGSVSSVAATAADATDWCAVADGFGLQSERVASLSKLEQALSAWRPEQGPQFLTLSFEPNRYREIAKAIR